jgi:hypothetical protein
MTQEFPNLIKDFVQIKSKLGMKLGEFFNNFLGYDLMD